MDKVIVSPRIVDEIEFYVSNDNEALGMSISGLARLCGVKHRSVTEMLDKLNSNPRGWECPEKLKVLLSKVFVLEAESLNGAKIVNAKACGKIIFYYGYDSKYATETAQINYDKFAEMGIESWIKKITGVGENNDDVLQLLKKVLIKVESLEKETKELKMEVGEYHKIRKTTISIYPGMDACLDMFNNDPKILAPAQIDITLSDWLKTKGVVLDKSRMHKFANLVAETYRTMTGNDPRQAMVAALNGRGASPRNVYAPREYPILEVSLAKLFNNI